MRLVELHDDRRRVVDVVDGDSNAKQKPVLSSRPMRPEEIKSGEWRGPGMPAPSYHRANSPEQYRAMCRVLLGKGFAPASPMPWTDDTIRVTKP